MLRSVALVALLVSTSACGHADASSPGCPAPLVRRENTCAPNVPTCSEVELPTTAGACVRVGVERCDEGFEPDDRGGCRAILPSTPCPQGELALPGERVCRPIDDCATEPLDADAIHVDASAAPGGDGTGARPVGTLGDALALAKARGGTPTLALAKGSYVGGVVPQLPVRIVGACASSVELVAPEGAGTFVVASAFPFELHRVSVRPGGAGGVFLVGEDVAGAPAEAAALLDRVWVHGGKGLGVGASSKRRALRLTVRDSLIEDVVDSGVAIVGAQGVVERTVIRRVAAAFSEHGSSGLYLAGPAGRLAVTRSLVERASHGLGLLGGSARIDGSLFRDLRRDAGVSSGGGVTVDGATTTLHLGGSVIERAELAGVLVSRGSATVERTTIRDMISGDDLGVGESVQVVQRGKLVMRDSLVDRSRALGVFLADGEATLERTIVRDTQPREHQQDFGAGIAAQPDEHASHLTLHQVVVRASWIAGIQVNGATVDIDSVFVTGVRAQQVDGLFGDGLALQSSRRRTSGDVLVGTAHVTGLVVRDVSRAGIGVFGATLDLSSSVLECSAIDLAVSDRFDSRGMVSHPFDLRDGGDNVCGCGTFGRCTGQTEGLSPAPSLHE